MRTISWAGYADNYKSAADTLVDSAVKGDAYVDTVVYPAVFLYRQYLELLLKGIIRCIRYLEKEGKFDHQNRHEFRLLWPEAKRLIHKHFKNETPNELIHLDGCFVEFEKHDARSFAFRYPIDTKGKETLEDLEHVNLRSLKETMQRISNLLGGVAETVEERVQVQCEFEAEMWYEGRP